ncbi:MAG: ROK family protein [Pirellulales bacterium]
MLLDLRQRELLRFIWRENRLSRWELHERTGVNPNAIGIEAAYLLQLGILREGAPESVGQGRPRTPLEIDTATRHILGVSLGPGQVEIAKLNLRGQLLGKTTQQSVETPAEAIAVAQRFIKQNIKEQTLAVGISSPGFLDAEKKAILFSSVTRTAQPLQIDGLYQAAGGKPIVFENDMHALAVRWLLTHLAEEHEDVLLAFLGDGRLGAAMLVEGRPNRGCLIGANELGHTRFPIETDPCYCGQIGCLERICSTAFLQRLNPEYSKDATIFERTARSADDDHAIQRLSQLLAMGLSNSVNFMRPNRLVIVSELTRYAGFSDALLRLIRGGLLFELVNHVRIDLWDQPGAVSAESAGWLALAGLFQEGWKSL